MSFNRRKSERRRIERRRGNRRSEGRLLDLDTEGEERRAPTQEEVEHLSGNLEYEIWMLREAVDYLARNRAQSGQPIANAYLESYLLHAASLIDFFFPSDALSRDRVVASDFVPDWSGHATIASELVEMRETARRFLNRLSYAAADYPRQQQITAVCEALEEIRETFEGLL